MGLAHAGFDVAPAADAVVGGLFGVVFAGLGVAAQVGGGFGFGGVPPGAGGGVEGGGELHGGAVGVEGGGVGDEGLEGVEVVGGGDGVFVAFEDGHGGCGLPFGAECVGGVGEGPGAVFGELHGVVLRFSRARTVVTFFACCFFEGFFIEASKW
ncbi:hypothetical protein UN64_19550 [Fictibacillus arsenicus]|uniref:Uncharacterized protein n=1 Tax=Fictibacillus arsenicus TaxID=255247 RepID=A0A1V3FZJ9_9BACL|nr:hypothetical protein UN64_19550 [Fictibacillus arsenicus]